MSFLSLIIKNPFRNKSRTILAIIGIGIGIATIVALGGVTEGLIVGAEDTLHSGGSDITVVGKDEMSSQSNLFGTTAISEEWINNISSIDGVASAVGVYSTMIMGEDGNMVFLVGINPKDVSFADLYMIQGRIFSDNPNDHEIIIGKLAKEETGAEIGDTVSYNGVDFKVVGIFETGNSYQDIGVFANLGAVQDLVKAEGYINSIFVKDNPGVGADVVAQRINDSYGDNVSIITSLSDIGVVKEMIAMLNGASLAISLLAIIIGAMGIINTMLMSVLERTRELGVLKSVGWSDGRILLMIIGESIVLTLVAAIIGSIVGIVGVYLLIFSNILVGLSPVFTVELFLNVFLIAVMVGILGGLYPAIKAVKLPPIEALRYE